MCKFLCHIYNEYVNFGKCLDTLTIYDNFFFLGNSSRLSKVLYFSFIIAI